MKIAAYGYRPDLIDSRDYLYKEAAAAPTSLDLRSQMPPIFDQGNLGSCTANAICMALEIPKLIPLSRLFLYYNERADQQTISSDSGSSLREGVKSATKVGVCSEGAWPYDISKFTLKPPTNAYTDATSHKLLSYERIPSHKSTTIPLIKSALVQGHLVVMGITAFASLESPQAAKTGIIPMPKNEAVIGGHALAIGGYDPKYISGPNSWGASWGDNGWYHMSYAYLKRYASDIWVVKT